MSTQWCVLTTRMGADIRDPAAADLAQALRDVHASKDPEHPNAWLRLGRDDGPMFVLDVYADRRVIFGQWADADFEDALAPESALDDVPYDVALALWQALGRGDVEAVRRAWQAVSQR